MADHRYSDILAEQEGRSQCSECHGMLVKIEVPYEGIGSHANSFLYLHCTGCDIYYMGYSEEDLRE